ncbi:hypothetical protein T492DRAFT_924169 [Pavlovales sp. CCMP2436]|nr:hypothetical protein T492DRAFT_924169 [Pavlovales sp. CCMP2436]
MVSWYLLSGRRHAAYEAAIRACSKMGSLCVRVCSAGSRRHAARRCPSVRLTVKFLRLDATGPDRGHWPHPNSHFHHISPIAAPLYQYAVSLKFTADYPSKPPICRFTPKIFHPNVYEDGLICLDIINGFFFVGFPLPRLIYYIYYTTF